MYDGRNQEGKLCAIMKILVCTISGFSASSRKAKKTLSAFVEAALEGQDVEYYHQFSTDPKCVVNLVGRVMRSENKKILLVGKSMGGVCAWWSIYKYWHNFKYWLFSPAGKKIGVVLLDPHGCQRGDGRIGAYGKMLNSFRTLRAWALRSDFKLHCLYQRNKYPEGAKISNSGNVTCERLSKDANHWVVTEIDTETGRRCADSVVDMLEWLNNESTNHN